MGRIDLVSTGPASGPIARLMAEFGNCPASGKIGENGSHYLRGGGRGQALALADALAEVKDHSRRCRQCHNLTEGELCNLCSDARRDASLVCVVEQPRDVTALERAATYRGLYHVLHGRLAPLDNIGPENLTVDALLERVREGGIAEVIMATNPTLEGDGTALFISNMLSSTGVRITRLARGLPSGSVLEFANNQMLADALEGRRTF